MEIHKILKILIRISILLLIVLSKVEAACNVCGALSGVACTSENQFQICVNGLPQPPVHTCATGKCVDTTAICENGVTQICTVCNTCSVDNRYACLDSTKYAFCFGTTIPSSVTGTCPTGFVCDPTATAPDICSPNIGTVSVCSKPSTTLTATEQCALIGTAGRFKVPSDTTCTKYVYCYGSAGLLLGQYYTCQGTTLFNPVLQQCVSSLTYICL